MPGSINKVQDIIFAFIFIFHLNGVAFYGNSTLALQVHIVEQLGFFFTCGNGLCGAKKPVGKRTFPVVNMCNYAKIAWKDVKAGAFFTACLFMLGRFLIGIYIDYSSTGSAYGAAGSLIVILVWVYYTAAILYFGAVFTRVYAEYLGARIEPADYAVYVEQLEKEKDVVVLPETAKPDAEVIVEPEPKPTPKPKAKKPVKTKPKPKEDGKK